MTFLEAQIIQDMQRTGHDIDLAVINQALMLTSDLDHLPCTKKLQANPKESRKMNVPQLSVCTRNEWSVQPIQHTAMPVLQRALDPVAGQAQDRDGRRNHCTPACRACGCSRLRASGSRDSPAGQDQRASAGAAGIEAQGVAA